MEDPSQPFLVVVYHRPAITDPDARAYEALSSILAGGPSSRLYRALVKEQQVALAAGAIPSLGGVKARAKMSLITRLSDNMGLAQELATTENLRGNWHLLFRELDEIDRVTAADVQRVAQKTFLNSNRTVGLIETARAGK